ncbi:MAG: linear amide C-N hydrolase [Anaerolineaceae bacterium]|nr:linear amide C-N hydrolase [Anaerolineaceae bacterium]
MKNKIIILGIFLSFILLPLSYLYNPLLSMLSLKKVDDFPLYQMKIYGDYGFDDFLKSGMDSSDISISNLPHNSTNFACTVFAALGEKQNPKLGRNFDWHTHPALILFSDPPDGYASVSMVDISYLGYDIDDQKIPLIERKNLLEAVYMPFDGMNEVGLGVGMNAVSEMSGSYNPQKITLSSLNIMRLILDHAKTVEEAIALIEQYNIEPQSEPPLHYLVADSSGDAAVIEFLNGEMKIVRSEQPWLISTNFIMANSNPDSYKSKCNRFRIAADELEALQGSATQKQAQEILYTTAQSNTIWSSLYDLKSGEILFYMSHNFDTPYHFQLEMRNSPRE